MNAVAEQPAANSRYEELLLTLQQRRRQRESLAEFTRGVFHIVSPGDEYLHNWHIDCMADYLMAVLRREILRLIINIPPRYMKSITTSVAFPAYALGHDPRTRFLCASYSGGLASKHSADCRDVVQSLWYRRLFPRTIINQERRSTDYWVTSEKGYRIATSVGGTATGHGGDILICDDPLNPKQAVSDAERETANRWFDQTFMSRLNDKKTGAIVVIMQRLHEKDVTGHLLSKEDSPIPWVHLKIPAIEEKRTVYGWTSPVMTREEGDLLHPEREGQRELDAMKVALGSYGFAGQYQQRPSPAGGGIFKRSWWKFYQALPKLVLRKIQCWDTAFKEKRENDWNVGLTIIEGEDGYYVIDCIKRKLEYPDMRKLLQTYHDAHKPNAVVVEDKASGQSLIQDTRRYTKIPIVPIPADRDLIARAHTITPQIEAGNVFLPDSAPWIHDFLTEFDQFPNAAHDDQIASFLTGMEYLLVGGSGWVSPTGVRVSETAGENW